MPNNLKFSCGVSSLKGLYTCITCYGRDSAIIKLCPFCAEKCHTDHNIMQVEVENFRFRNVMTTCINDCEC